jgi:hypothetical protein
VEPGSGGKAASLHREDREVTAWQTLGNAERQRTQGTQAQEQVPSMDTVGTGSPGVQAPAAPLKGAVTLAAPAAPLTLPLGA